MEMLRIIDSLSVYDDEKESMLEKPERFIRVDCGTKDGRKIERVFEAKWGHINKQIKEAIESIIAEIEECGISISDIVTMEAPKYPWMITQYVQISRDTKGRLYTSRFRAIL